MTEGSITNKLQKVLDNFSDLQHRIEKQTSYLETLQFVEDKPHETWNIHETSSPCYEEDENHKYPHLFHTMNPQLNNIACMLAYMIKNVEIIQPVRLEEFHQKMDEIQEEQKRSEERISIRLEDLLKLLENKERYLTQDELSQFLERGEDKGKTLVIPETTQPKEKTSESKQLSIRPPTSFF